MGVSACRRVGVSAFGVRRSAFGYPMHKLAHPQLVRPHLKPKTMISWAMPPARMAQIRRDPASEVVHVSPRRDFRPTPSRRVAVSPCRRVAVSPCRRVGPTL